MRMGDARRLLKYWSDSPPAHVAVLQLRDVVITGLGGTPPERGGTEQTLTTADEWAALAVQLGH